MENNFEKNICTNLVLARITEMDAKISSDEKFYTMVDDAIVCNVMELHKERAVKLGAMFSYLWEDLKKENSPLLLICLVEGYTIFLRREAEKLPEYVDLSEINDETKGQIAFLETIKHAMESAK
jgi:L-rhamnose mutarotase